MFSKCIINDGVQRGSLLSMTDNQYELFIKKSRQSICVITKYSTDGQKCLVSFNYKEQQFEAWFYMDQITTKKPSSFEGGNYIITLTCKCGNIHMLNTYQHKDTISKNWICSECNDKSESPYFNSQHTRNGADNSYFQIGDKRVYTL